MNRWPGSALTIVFVVVAISVVAQPGATRSPTHVDGFVQVLVPFDTMRIPGQFGSVWSAELWVRNDSSEPVNLFPEHCFWIGSEVPCSHRIDVPAETSKLLDVHDHDSASWSGVLLYVPEAKVDEIHFNLRVGDVSRPNELAGTEIPIVREGNLLSGRVTMLNVPIAEGARARLRVYAVDAAGAAFEVKVFREGTNDLLASAEYSMPFPTDPPFPPATPAVFDLTGVLAGIDPANASRVRLTIERTWPQGLPFWPLLSVTNDLTQEITVITSQ